MEYTKYFQVEGGSGEIQAELAKALQAKKFSVEMKDDSIIALRGSAWAQVWAFDITKYKTVLEIGIEDSGFSKKKVTFHYLINTGAAIPVASDQKKLDAEMAALLMGLRVAREM